MHKNQANKLLAANNSCFLYIATVRFQQISAERSINELHVVIDFAEIISFELLADFHCWSIMRKQSNFIVHVKTKAECHQG